jgi:hypothetical protein
LTAELLLQLVTMIATAGAVYGAIRADLHHLRERIGRLERQHDDFVATQIERKRHADRP